jgi:hypothetical protein
MASRLIAWINWRVLVALVAATLILLPSLSKPLQLLSVLDPYLYSLGVRLSVLPVPQLNVKLVAVSPEDIQTFSKIPHGKRRCNNYCCNLLCLRKNRLPVCWLMNCL